MCFTRLQVPEGKINPKFECRCFPMNFVVNNVVENWNVKLIQDKDKSLEDG